MISLPLSSLQNYIEKESFYRTNDDMRYLMDGPYSKRVYQLAQNATVTLNFLLLKSITRDPVDTDSSYLTIMSE